MTPSSTQPIDNQIRRLRFEHGEMTQEALAKAVGITRQTVIALESRATHPSLELAMKIAEVFDAGWMRFFSAEGRVMPAALRVASHVWFILSAAKVLILHGRNPRCSEPALDLIRE